MYLNCSCEKAFPPVDMHILNSYAKGVYSASDFFMKVHFKKRKKAGGTPVTVKQQK